MHYKDLSPVTKIGRVAGNGAWLDKILKLALSQSVTVSGNVAGISQVCSQERLSYSAPSLRPLRARWVADMRQRDPQ